MWERMCWVLKILINKKRKKTRKRTNENICIEKQYGDWMMDNLLSVLTFTTQKHTCAHSIDMPITHQNFKQIQQMKLGTRRIKCSCDTSVMNWRLVIISEPVFFSLKRRKRIGKKLKCKHIYGDWFYVAHTYKCKSICVNFRLLMRVLTVALR